MSIKEHIYSILINISNFLVKHTRKYDIILFNSFPDFSDNALYLYQYIRENRRDILDKYKLIWAVKQMPEKRNADIEKNVVLKKSLKGFWLMLHSKYIVITHNYYYGYVSAKGQLILNLWHGCGFKGMIQDDIKYKNGDYNIVTSDAFIESHSRAFRIPKEKILVTGLPRNDALFDVKENVLDRLGIKSNQYCKIIIWMPTYRKAKIGHTTLDGDASSFGAYSLTREQYVKLDTLLRSKGYYLIIKPHPMDSATADKANELKNIKCITNEDLDKADVALYALLAQTDALLSDYSSVIVDYLLLDKPIALVMSDSDSYKSTRGFTFENMEEYTPGPTISDFNGLYTYFDQIDEIDEKYEDKRHDISNRLQKYKDGNNCSRVCNAIWGAMINGD